MTPITTWRIFDSLRVELFIMDWLTSSMKLKISMLSRYVVAYMYCNKIIIMTTRLGMIYNNIYLEPDRDEVLNFIPTVSGPPFSRPAVTPFISYFICKVFLLYSRFCTFLPLMSIISYCHSVTPSSNFKGSLPGNTCAWAMNFVETNPVQYIN